MQKKYEILNDRMEECGISIGDILGKIKSICKEFYFAIIYTSHIEGLGNINSDFDIYVVGDVFPDNLSQIDDHKLLITKIKNTVCDIEFWNYKKLNKYIEITESKTDRNILKLLKRLEIGVVIEDYEERGIKYIERIGQLSLNDKIKEYYLTSANEEYDDAVKMFHGQRYECSLLCAHRAFDFAIAAINAKYGFANLNLKWVPQILMANRGYEIENLVKNYMYYQIYIQFTIDNMQNLLEEFLEFISDVLCHLELGFHDR